MPKQVEVTRAAMVNRLRRRLAKDGLILRMNRPLTYAYRKIGECAIIDPSGNALVEGGNVAEFALRYELLASWEHIISERRIPMSKKKGTSSKAEAAAHEGGNEENANLRHDPNVAALADEAAASEAEVCKSKPEKLRLVRVKMAALVHHRGKAIIAIPEEYMHCAEDVVRDLGDSLGECVDADSEEQKGIYHLEILDVEEIEGDPQSTEYKAVLDEAGEWCLEEALEAAEEAAPPVPPKPTRSAVPGPRLRS